MKYNTCSDVSEPVIGFQFFVYSFKNPADCKNMKGLNDLNTSMRGLIGSPGSATVLGSLKMATKSA